MNPYNEPAGQGSPAPQPPAPDVAADTGSKTTAAPVPPQAPGAVLRQAPGAVPPPYWPPGGPGGRGLLPWQSPARNHWEIPLLVILSVLVALLYLVVLLLVVTGNLSDLVLLLLVSPVLVYLARGFLWAGQRVNGVKMSPTQFPQGYALVHEAAARFGMRKVPDAYVVLGNGQINAFASGHGLRRYVVVYSDLFEVGGAARDPDALAFIIGHEVGHIAAGHTSYWRQLLNSIGSYLPVVGTSLIRAQEYTADNHGFANRPSGARGAMTVLAAGKYLTTSVGFDEFADRAFTETGFFVWLVNLMASHPVLTWRSQALRDRSRHGRMFLRPRPPVGYPLSQPQSGSYPPG